MANKLGALPKPDTQLLAWVNNFKTIITGSPTTYGLTAAQATAFGTLVGNFSTALAACEPGLRNKSSTALKNACRDVLKKSARELSSIITGQPNVTDSQRYALGLNVRAVPQPKPAPSSAPGIEVLRVLGRTVSARFTNTMAIGKRGRPFGCVGLQIYTMVGAAPSDNPADWKFEGLTNKTTVDLVFPDTVPAGGQIWITANWYNTTSRTGPAANPVTTYLQYGNTVVSLPQPAKKRRAA